MVGKRRRCWLSEGGDWLGNGMLLLLLLYTADVCIVYAKSRLRKAIDFCRHENVILRIKEITPCDLFEADMVRVGWDGDGGGGTSHGQHDVSI